LGKVQDNEEREIFEGVGSPAGWRSGGGTDVFDNALGDFGLSNQSSVFFALCKVLDKTAGPSNSLGLSATGLGGSRGVGEELLKNSKKRAGVLKGSNFLSVHAGRVLQDGSDAGLQKRKIHETDAAQVGFLLVLSDDFAKSSDNILRRGSKSHDTLVLRRDRKVIECKASKVASISALLSQTLSQRSQYVVLSTADHRDTVLLVAYITQFVNTLSGGGALLSLGVEHGVDKIRNVIESRGLGRSSLLLFLDGGFRILLSVFFVLFAAK